MRLRQHQIAQRVAGAQLAAQVPAAQRLQRLHLKKKWRLTCRTRLATLSVSTVRRVSLPGRAWQLQESQRWDSFFQIPKHLEKRRVYLETIGGGQQSLAGGAPLQMVDAARVEKFDQVAEYGWTHADYLHRPLRTEIEWK